MSRYRIAVKERVLPGAAEHALRATFLLGRTTDKAESVDDLAKAAKTGDNNQSRLQSTFSLGLEENLFNL